MMMMMMMMKLRLLNVTLSDMEQDDNAVFIREKSKSGPTANLRVVVEGGANVG
jgi:hypothetical protein